MALMLDFSRPGAPFDTARAAGSAKMSKRAEITLRIILACVIRNTPALAHLPIILLANKNAWYDVLPFLKSFQFQPDAYLIKPFSWDECSEIVTRLLAGRDTTKPPGD